MAVMLTDRDLAARWQVSRGYLANLRSAKAGPTFLKLGGAVRYRLADIEAYERAGITQTTGRSA